MLKHMNVLVLLVASTTYTSCGILDPVENCGGQGFFGPVSVTNCSTTPCAVQVGGVYTVEVEFISMIDCDELTLKLTAIVSGAQIVLYQTPIPGSVIYAGRPYSIEDTYTADGQLVGQPFDLEFQLLDSKSMQPIICVRAPFTVIT